MALCLSSCAYFLGENHGIDGFHILGTPSFQVYACEVCHSLIFQKMEDDKKSKRQNKRSILQKNLC